MNKPLALYPGSFDPVTRGHEDLVARASERFDLRVGVAVNPGKFPAFTLQERVRLIQKIVPKYGIDTLSVVRVPGSTAQWMKLNNIQKIVRGRRDSLDEVAEAQLDFFNRLEYPDIETVLFEAKDELKYASSSASKTLMKANHDPSSVIMLDVQEALAARLLSQYPVYITGGMGAGKSTVSRILEEQARSVGIPVRYIELDKVAHDIYTGLQEPYYVNIRRGLRATFGDAISPDGNWIDTKQLGQALCDASGNVDQDQLAKLDAIMFDAIEFRCKSMMKEFKGIILIEGIMKDGVNMSRLAHHNILLVDAPADVRFERTKAREQSKGKSRSDNFISSLMSLQADAIGIRDRAKKLQETAFHGSIEKIENGSTGVHPRNTFFQLLNQIDRYGELRATWILSKLGIQGNMREHLNFLQSRYNESHRYYHTWEHIVESLTTLFQIAIDLDIPDDEVVTIGAAILGHDLVYDVNMENYSENESNSAFVWSEYLRKNGVAVKKVNLISNLIEETRHGRTHVPDRLISRVMHDVDMAILGSSWSRYRIYGGDIRSEFAPVMAGNTFETARREKFLQPVLAQDGELYKTEWAADRFTANLISNIRHEIAGLS